MYDSDNTHYKLWQLFLIMGTGFCTVFYFFYQSPMLNSAYWIAEIIVVFFINQYIKKNSRWFYFLYPLLFAANIYLIKITLSPYITWSFDIFANKADSFVFERTPSILLTSYSKPEYTEYLSMAYLFSHIFMYATCFYYLYDTSIFKVKRFFNGLISLFSMGCIISLMLPVNAPGISLKSAYKTDLFGGQFAVLNDFIVKNYSNHIEALPCFSVAITFFIWLSLTRDAKLFSVILIPFILLIIIASVYLRYHYFSDVIIGLVLAVFCFFVISRGYRKHKIPTIQDDKF